MPGCFFRVLVLGTSAILWAAFDCFGPKKVLDLLELKDVMNSRACGLLPSKFWR